MFYCITVPIIVLLINLMFLHLMLRHYEIKEKNKNDDNI
jgi:hypothetical protein